MSFLCLLLTNCEWYCGIGWMGVSLHYQNNQASQYGFGLKHHIIMTIINQFDLLLYFIHEVFENPTVYSITSDQICINKVIITKDEIVGDVESEVKEVKYKTIQQFFIDNINN